MGVVVLHVGDEQRQQGLAGSGACGGALPHTPLAAPAADKLGRQDGARRDPRRPAFGLCRRPGVDVEVEASNRQQDLLNPEAGQTVLTEPDVRPPSLVDLLVQSQVRLARGDLLDLGPELSGEPRCQPFQGAVVELAGAALEIVDEELPHRPVGDVVPVDQLLDGEAAPDGGRTDGPRSAGREVAHGIQDLPGQKAAEGVVASAAGERDAVAPALPGVVEQCLRRQLVEPDPEDGEGAGHVEGAAETDAVAGLDCAHLFVEAVELRVGLGDAEEVGVVMDRARAERGEGRPDEAQAEHELHAHA